MNYNKKDKNNYIVTAVACNQGKLCKLAIPDKKKRTKKFNIYYGKLQCN